jgi:hypothetical protein
MNYKIVEVFLDGSEKYRVRVVIDENTTQFFKFDHYPTQEEVNIVVADYLSMTTDEPSIPNL